MKKYLRVTMPDGSKWDVPAELITKERAADYAKHDTGTTEGEDYDRVYREELEYTMSDDSEIADYAAGNMNWEDVQEHAVKVADPPEPDYQEGWVNGDKEVVEKQEESA